MKTTELMRDLTLEEMKEVNGGEQVIDGGTPFEVVVTYHRTSFWEVLLWAVTGGAYIPDLPYTSVEVM